MQLPGSSQRERAADARLHMPKIAKAMPNDDHSPQEMMSQLLALKELIADKLIMSADVDSSHSSVHVV